MELEKEEARPSWACGATAAEHPVSDLEKEESILQLITNPGRVTVPACLRSINELQNIS